MISSIQNGCVSRRSVASTNLSKIKLAIFVVLGYRVWFDLTVTMQFTFLEAEMLFWACEFSSISFGGEWSA